MDLKIVTPEEVFFDGPVTSVIAPGSIGYLGILKDHAPLATTLEVGNLIVKDKEGHAVTYKVGHGFLEVQKNHILVLTEKVGKL